MKLKHLFFNALAVMAFAACSSEAEEIKPSEKAETATVEIDLEGEYNNGQTRALTFDGTEYPLFTHETGLTDWKTHCFIRNEAGTVQFYALVDWTASVNSSTGAITLKIKDSKLTLQGSGGSNPATTATLPKAGERWYIAGIAGGGVLEANNTKVNFAYNQSLDASLAANQLRVPIAFGWTPFTIAKPVSERAPRIVVQFQPQGTLLSVHVDNTKNRGKNALSTQVKVRSNALSQSGLFDYSTAAARATYTAAPKWDFTNASATTETFVRDVNINFGAKKIYYLWAMPRTTAPSGGFKTETYIAHYKSFAEGTNTLPVAKTTTFAKGNTYYTGLDIDRPKMALEYVAEYNMKSNTTFATSHSNNAAEYFNWSTAVANFGSAKKLNINNIDYHLPTKNEWKSVVPDYNRYEAVVFYNPTSTSLSDVTESVVIGAKQATYTSDYQSPGTSYTLGTSAGYALRLKGGDNSMKSAWRYEFSANPASASLGGDQMMMTIRCRYLGPSSTTTLSDIAQETFWASNNQDDVVKTFPAGGFIFEDGSNIAIGTKGYYWSADEISTMTDRAWSMFYNWRYAHSDSTIEPSSDPNKKQSNSKVHKLSVRLFSND